jgi:hypothetical protein
MKSVSQSLHRFNHSHNGYGLGFRRTRKKNIAKEWVGPSKTTGGGDEHLFVRYRVHDFPSAH